MDPAPFLGIAGIRVDLLDTPDARISAQRQIKFLHLVAESLGDEILGIHLAARFEPREVGLLYFVLASSDNLREALRRVERYTCIVNEGVRLTRLNHQQVGLRCAYSGLSRHSDRHQVEFILTLVSKIASKISGLRVKPIRMSFSHPAFERQREAESIIGCEIVYSAPADEIVFDRSVADRTLILTDPYLSNLLVGFCEQTLAHRSRPVEALRTRVENAIVPLLPHGMAKVSEVGRALGMSERSLSRQLQADGLSFSEIRAGLKRDLAEHYLRASGLSVSEIAWLLGFSDPTSFTHAFRRWTGRPPVSQRRRSLKTSMTA